MDGKQAKEKEQSEFRANFDSDGAFEKMDTNLRKVARQLKREMKKRAHLEEALQSALEAQKPQNDSAHKSLERGWISPNTILAAFTALGIVAIILLGVQTSVQLITNFELSDQSRKIGVEMTSVRDLQVKHEARVNEMKDNLELHLKSLEEEFGQSTESRIDEADKKISDINSQTFAMRNRSTSINHVVALMRLADSFLHFQADAASAEQYASQASKILDKATSGKSSELGNVELDSLRHGLDLILTQCQLHQGNFLALRDTSQRLVESEAENEIGEQLMGLAILHNTCISKDAEFRRENAMEASTHFDASVKKNTSLVYNSLALFSAGEFLRAKDKASLFLTSFPTEGLQQRKLGSSVGAYLELAENLRLLSDFLINPAIELPMFECRLNVGDLSIQDARLVDSVVSNAIVDKGDWIKDENRANEFGLYCARLLTSARKACRGFPEQPEGSACANCGVHGGNAVSFDTDLARAVERFSLVPTLHDPVLHQNSSFGTKNGEFVKMKWIQLHNETRTRTRPQTRYKEENTSRTTNVLDPETKEFKVEEITIIVPYTENVTEKYTVNVPLLHSENFPINEELEPRAYVPAEFTLPSSHEALQSGNVILNSQTNVSVPIRGRISDSMGNTTGRSPNLKLSEPAPFAEPPEDDKGYWDRNK